MLKNPFNLSVYKVMKDDKIDLIDLSKSKIIKNDLVLNSDVSPSNHIVLLNLDFDNNKYFNKLVVGDVFFNHQDKHYYLFLAITVKTSLRYLNFFKFDELEMKKYNERIEAKKKYTNLTYYTVSLDFISYIESPTNKNKLHVNIDDVNFEEMIYLSNIFYNENYHNKLNAFSKEHQIVMNEDVIYFFKLMRNPLSYLNDFNILFKEKNSDLVIEKNIDSCDFKFIENNIDSWTPLVSIRIKVKNLFETNKLYLNDIYYIKNLNKIHKQGMVVYDKNNFQFKILLPNKSFIDLNEVNFPANIQYNNNHHILSDEDDVKAQVNYEKHLLLFL